MSTKSRILSNIGAAAVIGGAQAKSIGRASWKVFDDQKRVQIMFPTLPVAVGLTLDAQKLDELIAMLGAIRLNIVPAIAPDGARQGQINAVVNQPWVGGYVPGTSDRVLQLHDPRFGCLAFTFPESEAKRMAEVLMQDPPKYPAPGKAN